MASPTLALPSGGGTKPRGVLIQATLLAVAAGAMLFGAFLAAYLHMRRLAHPFPPEGAKIDEYWGNLMAGTMLMGSVTAEWGAIAVKRGQRQQAMAGFAITIVLGLAFLNLVSFSAGHVEFEATTNPYSLLVTAMVMALGIVTGLAVAFCSLTLFRLAGRQLMEPDAEQPRATAIVFHFVTAATLAVWYTVIVLK